MKRLLFFAGLAAVITPLLADTITQSNLAAYLDSNGNLLAVGDTILDCEGATIEGDITIDGGSLTIKGGVETTAQENFLAVYNDGSNHLYYVDKEGDGVLLLEGVRLADIDYFVGKFSGSFSGSSVRDKVPVRGYIYDRTDEKALVQFRLVEGGSVKWMNYEVYQIGADIYAKGYKYASYFEAGGSSNANRRVRDRQEVVESSQLLTAIAANDGHYGIHYVTAVMKSRSYIFRGTINATEVINQNANITFQAKENRQTTIPAFKSGCGTLHFVGSGETVRWEEFSPIEEAVLIENAKVWELVPMSARLTGRSVSGRPKPARVTNLKRTEDGASFWVELENDGFMKGAKIVLRQDGDNVTIKTEFSRYAGGAYWTVGLDLEYDYWENTIAQNTSEYGYNADQLVFVRGGAFKWAETTGTTAEGPIYIENCTVTTDSPASFGARQDVHVLSGGDFQYKNTTYSYASSGDGRCFYIEQGGHMGNYPYAQSWTLGANDGITVTDGTYSFAAGSRHGNHVYLEHVTLAGDALIDGAGCWRVGYYSDAELKVLSGNPTVAARSCYTLGGNHDFYIDVAAGSTLLMGSELGQESTQYGALNIVKRGEGNVLMRRDSKAWTWGITFEGGLVTYKHKNGLKGNNVTLNGGTFEFVTQTDDAIETMGTLTLAGNSTLDVASGRKAIAFADSSATEWTANTVLTIPATTDLKAKPIRIGTTASALTKEQLKQIYYAGNAKFRGRVKLDAEGYLLPDATGFAVLIR